MIQTLPSDLRYAIRGLLARPLFALVAIASLALGLGVNTAIFSLFQQVALQPLPVHAPGELFNVRAPGIRNGWSSASTIGSNQEILSHPMFRDLQREAPSALVSGLAGHRAFNAWLGGGGDEAIAAAVMVSGNYFGVLGLRAAAGRLLTEADDDPRDPAQVVVLSHALWQQRFDAASDVIGRTLRVNEQPLTVIGVAPPGFSGTTRGHRSGLFVPLSLAPQLQPAANHVLDERRSHWVYAFGRRAPGASLAAAQDALNVPYARILDEIDAPLNSFRDEARLAEFRARRLELVPGARGQSLAAREATRPLALLSAIAAVVLLIACLNLANLMLARGADRVGEFALRASIGASRGRLLRQLLAESSLLAMAGAALAWPLAALASHALIAWLPSAAARPLDPGLDGTALLFTAACTVAAVLLSGLWPAVRLASVTPHAALRGDGMRTAGRGGSRFRNGLATAQIGLSMASLVLAGLFAKSLYNLAVVDVGMHTASVAVVTVAPSTLVGVDTVDVTRLYERIEGELAGVPGVIAVTSSTVPLLAQHVSQTNLERVDGRDVEESAPSPNYSFIGPGFISTMGIRLLAGREFTGADDADAPPVVIVNRRFAEVFGIGPNPVGKRIALGGERNVEREIVGLIDDSKYSTIRDAHEPLFLLPRHQRPSAEPLTFYVHAAVPPATLLDDIRRAITAVDPELHVDGLRTLPEQIAATVAMERFVGVLSAAFALLATALAALGLYGVLSYALACRMREIGLRLALGAAPARLARMLLTQVGHMTVVGGVLGLVAALVAGRAAQALLFGLEGHDPAVLAGAAIVLALVAFAAGLLPARRAARVEPMIALRHE